MKFIDISSWHSFFLLFFFVINGDVIEALTYDYRATTKCLVEAWDAQYGGALNRTLPSDSISQRVLLEEGKLYAFAAWIQLNEGREVISVRFRRPYGKEYLHGGTVIAKHGCWSMLKGGILANFSGPVHITFETKNTSVEVWVDNVSLQPFTKKQWRLHQEHTINKVRKHKVKFQVTNQDNTRLQGAKISLRQKKAGFLIGCEINSYILNITKYKEWFLASKFSVTAFGNEMKWYFTEEKQQGHENYTIPDAMLQLCEQNQIDVRGHNIFWDDPKYQPEWLDPRISPKRLRKLVEKRIKSIVLRYKGRLIHWDVMNENLHFKFYEEKLGRNATYEVFSRVHEVDQRPILFMNEYNTIEVSEDIESMPARYARKLKKIGAYNREMLPLGVGLESRFGHDHPNFAYMRAGIDYLASMGFSVWLTEVFVDKGPNQAEYLEEVLREGYSHPSVEGIVIWPTSPFSTECKMCLVDVQQDFKKTKTGDIVDEFIAKLWSSRPLKFTTNEQGFSESILLIGDYDVNVRHPTTNKFTKFKLKVTEKSAHLVHLHLD
ncbi:unnamed protein product [Amaranthus hypochondriacus]